MSVARIRLHPSAPPRSQSALITVALVCTSLLPASAQRRETHPSPVTILRHSLDSERMVNIRGTESVIVQPPRATNMVSMTREVIRSREGISLTRWTDPPDQRGLVMLDDGTWTKCYQPSEGVTMVSRSAPRPRDANAVERQMRLILRNYRVAYEGMAPMAGRQCYKLRLTPVHSISRVVRLWVDRDNGAVLSRMESTLRGDTLLVSSFNGVTFPTSQSVADLRRALPANAKHVNCSRSPILKSFAQVRRRVKFPFCPPYAMPGGYEFEHAEIISVQGVLSSWLRYTDGIGEITICQNVTKAEPRPNGYRAIYRYVNEMRNSVVEQEVGQTNFCLVGHCSPDGLARVAEALDEQKERMRLRGIAREFHLPVEALAGLRNQGLGTDTLSALAAISQQAHAPLGALLPLCQEGYGWTAIARRFRADVNRIWKRVRAYECR